jgi:hypothetical protein
MLDVKKNCSLSKRRPMSVLLKKLKGLKLNRTSRKFSKMPELQPSLKVSWIPKLLN